MSHLILSKEEECHVNFHKEQSAPILHDLLRYHHRRFLSRCSGFHPISIFYERSELILSPYLFLEDRHSPKSREYTSVFLYFEQSIICTYHNSTYSECQRLVVHFLSYFIQNITFIDCVLNLSRIQNKNLHKDIFKVSQCTAQRFYPFSYASLYQKV